VICCSESVSGARVSHICRAVRSTNGSTPPVQPREARRAISRRPKGAHADQRRVRDPVRSCPPALERRPLREHGRVRSRPPHIRSRQALERPSLTSSGRVVVGSRSCCCR
jgi:hypothetical protein